MCAVSRTYQRKDPGNQGYWFAFHTHQREFLEVTTAGYAGFGCGSPDRIVLFPAHELAPLLDRMPETQRNGRSYRHLRIRQKDGEWTLDFRKGEHQVITQYVLPKMT